MKSIQVTLYDIFGFVFPGGICLASLFLFYWAVCLPGDVRVAEPTTLGWIVLLVTSYLLGHVVQGAANIVEKALPRTENLVLTSRARLSLPDDVITAATRKARVLLDVGFGAQLEPHHIFEACDHYVQQEGETELREIYVYREGFYRGLSLASVLFAVSLIVRATRGAGHLSLWGVSLEFGALSLFVAAAAALLLAVIWFERYRRFGAYKVRNAIYGALVLGK